MNILVTLPRGPVRETFMTPDVWDALRAVGAVETNEMDRNWTPEELRDRLHGVDVCVTGWGTAMLGADVLAGADRLRFIAHTGGSVFPLVDSAAYDRGIRVVSGNWLYAESVAESVVAYALTCLRDLPKYASVVQSGDWKAEDDYNEGLLDQTVGLVGFGLVARYLVGMLKPFRARVKAYDPFAADGVLQAHGVERATLEDALRCKIVSIHAAQTPATYHLIGAEQLKLIPDGAVLVNTARGSILDEDALARELATGRFRAALDVYTEEPLPPGSGLRGLPNAFLMPHMGGPTVDRRRIVTLELIEEIKSFAAGRPLRFEIGREYAAAMTR